MQRYSCFEKTNYISGSLVGNACRNSYKIVTGISKENSEFLDMFRISTLQAVHCRTFICRQQTTTPSERKRNVTAIKYLVHIATFRNKSPKGVASSVNLG